LLSGAAIWRSGQEGLAMGNLERLRLERLADGLLAPWVGTDRPGVSIGIVRGEQLLAHRSAGMAHVELGVPIGPETRFRIASVSKQFTCAAILLLAAEGRLSVDDDVRKYIPELADFGATITLDHLMHNTSGLRDMLEIMRFGGVDLSQPVTPDDLMAGIFRQRTLNFAPGSRYLYSNSSFLLLGRVVERVSGQRLRDFLAARLLGPAGMTMTCMVESTAELVPGLAEGYVPKADGGWARARHGFPVHGEGGLISSVADLALWHRNYVTGRVGGPALAAALMTQAAFSNGRMNHYARGLATARVRGVKTIGHGGLWPGFRTEFLRIPERDEAVIVIANNALADPYQIGQGVLAGLLEGAPGVHPVPAMPQGLERYAGRFVDRANAATVEFTLTAEGALQGNANGQLFTFRAEPDGRLAARRAAEDWTMRLAPDGDTLEVELDVGTPATYHRIAAGAAPPADLPGRYRSPEMDAVWNIIPDAASETDAMQVHVAGLLANAGPWPVEGIEGDICRIHMPNTLFRGWADARVVRDAAGRITGLLLHTGRVKQLDFVRA
jgi:CubicO group peptidase (beta-lactamase class C family)